MIVSFLFHRVLLFYDCSLSWSLEEWVDVKSPERPVLPSESVRFRRLLLWIRSFFVIFVAERLAHLEIYCYESP